MMQIRNPVYTATGAIDCEVAHPQLGWIPFTASPQDIEAHGRDIFAAARQMRPAEYVAPSGPAPEDILALERAGMRLSFSQLLIGLVTEGWLSEPEGEAWLAGQLPAAVSALIATLPKEQRFAARARALRPSVVERMDPLVVLLASAQSREADELDVFFRTYALS
jgi:hypothetical protein